MIDLRIACGDAARPDKSGLAVATFALAGMTFGVPALDVQEIIRPQAITRVPLADRSVAGLLNLRGQLVTAIDLRARLGLPASPATVGVVVRTRDGLFSLLADDLGDVIDISPHALAPLPETVSPRVRDAVHGAVQLPDRLLLVLITEALGAAP